VSFCQCAWALIMAGFGCLLFVAMEFTPRREPPAFIDFVFTIPGGKIIIASWVFAACSFLAGWLLALRKQYVFCMVFASVNCLIFPVGTIFGVYSLMVLLRPGVKALFERPIVPQSSL
jgi:hypothetical protein